MATELTLYYDSQCPLCSWEIDALRRHDDEQRIEFVDLHAADLYTRHPGIDRQRALELLHGSLADGHMIYGLDVTVMAWSLVGRHRWLRLLRLPGIALFADVAYRFFARHRHRFTGQRKAVACERCSRGPSA